ncbi:MAG: PASTA domain-containing protein [Treponema sp.]|nr:PASTA domain-containing protein [Candidatus Treponema caballi]
MDSLQHNGLTLLFSAIGMLVIMAGIFVAVFFLVLQSPEQVMVPNVVGEPLEEALLAMQVKELYPKIQLRYSASAADKGTVLEQDPPASTIVKAGRRINLTVSRGIVVDRVGNYVGQKVDDVRISLQAAFSGMAVQLINVPETLMYRADESEPGTILEQDPLPDTSITSPVTLSLIVSSGPGNETTRVPWLVGKSLNDALLQMSRTKIIFNWTARLLEEGETAGTVVSQKVPGTDGQASAYSVSECVIAMPEGIENDLSYGIFSTELAAYPYPLKVQIDVIPPEGDSYTLVTFRHLGGELTVPYAVPQFSELILSVEDKELMRQIVR